MNDLKKIMSENIKAIRNSSFKSQRGFAETIGFTAAAVNRWERGYVLPHVEALWQMSQVFEIPIECFFEDGGVKCHLQKKS